jgi:hypothetical protein
MCGMSRTYEDFPIGTVLVSRRLRISEEEIIEFAHRYDRRPLRQRLADGSPFDAALH